VQSGFDDTPSGTGLDLTGEWVGTYDFGPNGRERGDEVVRITQAEGTVVAVKVTGDVNVPAGQVTWRARLDTGQGEGQLAELGFVNPRFVPVRLQVLNPDLLFIEGGGWNTHFRRRGSGVDQEWGRSILGRLFRRWFLSKPA
jgi:hypothetical protein